MLRKSFIKSLKAGGLDRYLREIEAHVPFYLMNGSKDSTTITTKSELWDKDCEDFYFKAL